MSVYFTPNTEFLSLHTGDLSQLVNLKSHRNSYFILGGDLNAKHSFWGNTTSNVSGDRLFDWFSVNCVSEKLKLLHSNLPSYNSSATSSYLDIFLISDNITVHHNQQNFPNLKTIDFESDHCAVELRVSVNFKIPRQPPKQIPNYSAVNWIDLNECLDSELEDLQIPISKALTKREIDTILTKLEAILASTMNRHVPLTTINYSTQIPLPANILKFIKFKNSLRRQLYRNRHSPTSQTIKSLVSNANNIIKQLIQIHYENHWVTKLSSLKSNNNTFKEINRITNRKGTHSIPTLIDPIAKVRVEEALGKANLLGQTFEDITNQNNKLGYDWFTNMINEQVRNYIKTNGRPLASISDKNHITSEIHCRNDNFVKNFATSNDIKCIIKSRNSKKSSGRDNIPNYVLKKLSLKFSETLSIIINHCYNLGYFPNRWKLAVVAPIHKIGNSPQLPSNYRQISLLSNISKIYEKFILEKIQVHCDEFGLIPDKQFGFRASHSTTNAAVILKTDIALKLNQKIPTIACLLDFEKAFDTAWTEGVIFKLIKLQFDSHLIKTVHSFLTNRFFQVRVDNTLSRTYTIKAGVPQGSILGPVLYSLFISDIPEPIPHQIPIKSLIYADDIIIYTSKKNIKKAEEDLNEYLKTLSEYFNKWKIKINIAKCETICFKGVKILTKQQKERCKNFQLKINGIAMKRTDKVKYLGITLTGNLKPYNHIKAILQKAIISFNNIKKILHYKSSLQRKIKLMCYKQLIRPLLTYGFPAWSDLSSSQMEKLRQFERKILRACTRIYRKPDSYHFINNNTLYRESNIKRIDVHMINGCIKFFDKAKISSNLLIKSSASTTEPTTEEEEYKYPPPYTIKHLHDNNQLLNDADQLTYYHRPSRPTTEHMVYNISQ